MKKLVYHNILAAMEIPPDLTNGAVIVEMNGENSMCISNYTGIIEFSVNRLLLQCKNTRFEVVGRNLEIEVYTKDELRLKGVIEQTQYV